MVNEFLRFLESPSFPPFSPDELEKIHLSVVDGQEIVPKGRVSGVSPLTEYGMKERGEILFSIPSFMPEINFLFHHGTRRFNNGHERIVRTRSGEVIKKTPLTESVYFTRFVGIMKRETETTTSYRQLRQYWDEDNLIEEVEEKITNELVERCYFTRDTYPWPGIQEGQDEDALATIQIISSDFIPPLSYKHVQGLLIHQGLPVAPVKALVTLRGSELVEPTSHFPNPDVTEAPMDPREGLDWWRKRISA